MFVPTAREGLKKNPVPTHGMYHYWYQDKRSHFVQERWYPTGMCWLLHIVHTTKVQKTLLPWLGIMIGIRRTTLTQWMLNASRIIWATIQYWWILTLPCWHWVKRLILEAVKDQHVFHVPPISKIEEWRTVSLLPVDGDLRELRMGTQLALIQWN